MKKLYILGLLVSLCWNAVAQTTLTLPRKSTFFIWDDQNPNTAGWMLAGDYAHVYNNRGQETERLFRISGMNQSKTINTYENFVLKETMNQTWNLLTNDWRDNLKSTYTLDGQGRIATMVMQTSFGRSAPLVNTLKSIYTYTGSSKNASSVLHQEWNATSSTWVDDTREINLTWSTDANNPHALTGYVEQELQNGTWVNAERFTSTYDAGTRKLTQTLEKPAGTGWVNDERTIMTYDTRMNMTNMLEQKWSGSAWVFDGELQYVLTYNSNNVLTEKVTRTKDEEGDAFENAFKDVYSDFQSFTITKSAERLPESSLAVYPNPAAGDVKVALTNVDFKEASVELFNTQGVKVYGSTFNRSEMTAGALVIPTEQLASGVYILHINTNTNKQISRRILKN